MGRWSACQIMNKIYIKAIYVSTVLNLTLSYLSQASRTDLNNTNSKFDLNDVKDNRKISDD